MRTIRRLPSCLRKPSISIRNLPVVHIAYGDSLFALGRFDEATQAILTGLEIYPKYAENPINRREFYNNPSEFDRQLRNLENYVNTHPSNLNARFLLGYNYFFTQAYEKAEEQLKAVLSSESLHSSAQYLNGLDPAIQHPKTQKISVSRIVSTVGLGSRHLNSTDSGLFGPCQNIRLRFCLSANDKRSMV